MVLRQVWSHLRLEERQRDLVPEAWVGAKRSGPTGEVETTFTTIRLTTNFMDGNKPFARDDGGMEHGAGHV